MDRGIANCVSLIKFVNVARGNRVKFGKEVLIARKLLGIQPGSRVAVKDRTFFGPG